MTEATALNKFSCPYCGGALPRRGFWGSAPASGAANGALAVGTGGDIHTNSLHHLKGSARGRVEHSRGGCAPHSQNEQL